MYMYNSNSIHDKEQQNIKNELELKQYKISHNCQHYRNTCIYNLLLRTKVKMLREESKLREEHWEERLKHSEQLTFTISEARNAIIV